MGIRIALTGFGTLRRTRFRGCGIIGPLAVILLLASGRHVMAQAAIGIALPPSTMLPQEAAGQLQQLIGDREANVTKNKVFVALKKIQEQQPQLHVLQASVIAAKSQWRAADFELTKVSKLAFGTAGNGMAGQLNNARERLDAAERALQESQRKLAGFVQANLQPWLNKVDAARPEWARIYQAMRNLVPTDRADPRAGEVSAIYAAECRRQEHFVEGYVLGAITAIYANELREATDSLEKAARMIVDFQLGDLLVSADFCHAWLLLGKPDACKPVVEFIKAMADTATSIEQDCIVGMHAYATRKFNDGATYYGRAIHKQARLKRQAGLDAPPALWGEAAMLFMQMDDRNQKNKAKHVLQKADPHNQSGAWQVLRARATLAAEDGRWGDAEVLLATSESRAPLVKQAELRAQLAGYRQKTRWDVRTFQPPAVAGAGGAPGTVNVNAQAPSNPGLGDVANALGGLGAAMQATNRAIEDQKATDEARSPPADEEPEDPRYSYDGRFPKSEFRKRFEALRGKNDIASLQTWRAMTLALVDKGLTLNEIDWAAQQFNNRIRLESLRGEEQVRFRKYLEFTKDGW
jgi:hypothetical protein